MAKKSMANKLKEKELKKKEYLVNAFEQVQEDEEIVTKEPTREIKNEKPIKKKVVKKVEKTYAEKAIQGAIDSVDDENIEDKRKKKTIKSTMYIYEEVNHALGLIKAMYKIPMVEFVNSKLSEVIKKEYPKVWDMVEENSKSQ